MSTRMFMAKTLQMLEYGYVYKYHVVRDKPDGRYKS